jgi:hypothetical protein
MIIVPIRTAKNLRSVRLSNSQVESDFLMTLLKRQAPQFPNLKIVSAAHSMFCKQSAHVSALLLTNVAFVFVNFRHALQVLMSATMKEELFSAYFDKCPIVYVSGRMFPVHQHYIAEALEVVAQGQHILAAERGRLSNYNADAMDDTYDSILVPTPGAASRGKMGHTAKGTGQKVHALRDPSIVGACYHSPPSDDMSFLITFACLRTSIHIRCAWQPGPACARLQPGPGGGTGDPDHHHAGVPRQPHRHLHVRIRRARPRHPGRPRTHTGNSGSTRDKAGRSTGTGEPPGKDPSRRGEIPH